MSTRHTLVCGRVSAFASIVAFGLLVSACGSDPGFTDDDDGTTQAALDTTAKIEGFLDGRPLVMEAAGIPSHPNGYLADINLEQATQCYHRVEMTLSGANFAVSSALGTLENAPAKGDIGTCNTGATSTELSFSSVSHLIENIDGDAECFDFTISYAGFSQEGRGSIDEARSALSLELYFKDQATGMRCADGPPGSAGVQLNGAPFEGNAVQVYTILTES
jgi:hypothetical protein